MSDRPASGRMPSIKQMENIAAAQHKPPPTRAALAPNDDLPAGARAV